MCTIGLPIFSCNGGEKCFGCKDQRVLSYHLDYKKGICTKDGVEISKIIKGSQIEKYLKEVYGRSKLNYVEYLTKEDSIRSRDLSYQNTISIWKNSTPKIKLILNNNEEAIVGAKVEVTGLIRDHSCVNDPVVETKMAVDTVRVTVVNFEGYSCVDFKGETFMSETLLTENGFETIRF